MKTSRIDQNGRWIDCPACGLQIQHDRPEQDFGEQQQLRLYTCEYCGFESAYKPR